MPAKATDFLNYIRRRSGEEEEENNNKKSLTFFCTQLPIGLIVSRNKTIN